MKGSGIGLWLAFVLLVTPLSGAEATGVAQLSFSKSLPADQGVSRVGGMVTYTFLVTNTGWVTVTGVDIDETGFGGSGPLGAFECGHIIDGAFVVDHELALGSVTLRAGEAMICQAQYVVLLADAPFTPLTNTAFAVGTQGVFNEPVQSNRDSATFEIIATPT